MQRIQEGDQRRRLRRAEIFAIGRHVAATLQYLPDQFIAGQACGDSVERRTALAAFTAESVTVAALFDLKHQRALSFERGTALEQWGGNRSSAPRVHHWRPR